jgi:hypothetical protein
MHLAPGVSDPSSRPLVARALSVRMDPVIFAHLKPALAAADLPAILNPPKWYGEGELWAEAVSSPLMSFVGIGPQFHTPADIPEDVTSPELLGQVYDAIVTAVDAFLLQTER